MIWIIILSYHIIVILLFDFVACEKKKDSIDWTLLSTNEIPCKLNVKTSCCVGGKIAWVISINMYISIWQWVSAEP